MGLEAVGLPETLLSSAAISRPGGTIAHFGVHGAPLQLPMQDLWIPDVILTMLLVNIVSIRH